MSKKAHINISQDRHDKELESIGSIFMPMVKDMISAEDVSMKFPRTLTKGERRKIHPGNIEIVKLQVEPKATDPLEAKIAEFDAVIAEADADFYAALHGEE
jgi:hypothetical protein